MTNGAPRAGAVGPGIYHYIITLNSQGGLYHMKTAVINIAPGKVVEYRGEPCMVLEHRPEGTLLLGVEWVKHPFGSTNNFAASALRKHLNSLYLESLTNNHPDEIITRTVDLTALNGSKEYGTCECKVAPLSLDEIRKYHGILTNPETWEWTVTPWSTPAVDEDDTWVLGLVTDGNFSYSICSDTGGSRPAFLIPSTYAVEADGNPLEQYSAQELAVELARRADK